MTDTPKTPQPEPYDLDKCTVKIVLLLHPCQTDANDADCTIAISTHEDIPLTKIVKRSALLVRGAQSQLDLPEPVTDLLAELKADLPQREFHARVKQSKTSKQKTTKTTKSSKIPQPTESDTSTIKQVQLF